MKRAAALALLLLAPMARAQVTDATSTTILRLKPEWKAGNTQTGFWATEYVGVSVRGLEMPGVQDIRIYFSGWGEAATIPGLSGDIDLLYVQGSLLQQHLTLTLGRQLIIGGAARVLQLDGLNAAVAIGKGFGFTAYAGVPTESRFHYPEGNFAFGGRAFWRPTYQSEVGVSFLEILSDGVVARQDLGIDGRWQMLRSLGVSASAVLSLQEMRFADADLTVTWTPIAKVEVFAKASQQEPDLFLPFTSIFTVFTDSQRDTLGGGAFWQAMPRLSFYGEYQHLWVEGGNGDQLELRATYKFTRKSTVGFNTRLIFIPSDGSTEIRAWVIQAISQKVKLSADLDWVLLQNPINLEHVSIVGTVSATWLIGSGWSGMLSGTFGVTPFFQTRYTLTARIGYDFASLLARKATP